MIRRGVPFVALLLLIVAGGAGLSFTRGGPESAGQSAAGEHEIADRALLVGQMLADTPLSAAAVKGAASTAPVASHEKAPAGSTGMAKKFDRGLLAAHAQGPSTPIASPVPMEPAPAGVLLVSAHTGGWITPCGCPGTQAGGVARRAGYGELLRKTFPGLDVDYFDLGGFMMDRSPIERTTTAAVIDAMNVIGYRGVNVAFYDLGRTSDQAEFIASRLQTPRFSANVRFDDTGTLAFPPYLIRSYPSAGGEAPIRVGLLGLVDDRFPLFAFGAGGRSLVSGPMSEALARYLPELRSKVDLVVLFAEIRPETLYALVKDVEGIDFAVVGQGTQFVTDPQRIHDTPYVALGNQGKNLAELRISRKDGKPVLVPFVHFLDERFPEDPGLARTTEEKIDTINEASRRSLRSEPVTPSKIAPYVGAQACASCHKSAFDVWKSSRHAHAFATLERLKRDYTTSCVSCHVTGSDALEGGGFVNPRATPQLLNVQCEQCHGPAQSHLENPSAEYGKVGEARCSTCHSGATDPHFDFATRWKTIAH